LADANNKVLLWREHHSHLVQNVGSISPSECEYPLAYEQVPSQGNVSLSPDKGGTSIVNVSGNMCTKNVSEVSKSPQFSAMKNNFSSGVCSSPNSGTTDAVILSGNRTFIIRSENNELGIKSPKKLKGVLAESLEAKQPVQFHSMCSTRRSNSNSHTNLQQNGIETASIESSVKSPSKQNEAKNSSIALNQHQSTSGIQAGDCSDSGVACTSGDSLDVPVDKVSVEQFPISEDGYESDCSGVAYRVCITR
jgi:hypothetical protein